MIKGVAGQTAGAQMINATTGAAFAGTVTVYVTGDGGTQAIGSVGSGLCTSEGNGYFSYRPATAETNYDLVAFTFIGTGAIPVTVQFSTLSSAQSGAVQTTSAPGAVTVRAIAESALQEIGALASGEDADAADTVLVLGKLNRILDNWNADRALIYQDTFEQYTITPALQPHTIGPSSATWTATTRPVSIEGASLIISGYYYPLNIRTAEWWQALVVPGLTSSIPTDLFYNPTWDNGAIYLWPVPTTAYDLQVWTRGLLSLVSIGDTLSLPPGYEDAITLTLAEEIAAPFGKEVPEQTAKSARRARSRIMENNTVVPRIMVADPGMGGSRRSSFFNYQTGRLQ